MPTLLVVGTINLYPPPGPDWHVIHVDASSRGIWDPKHRCNVPVDVVADMRDLPFGPGSVDRVQSWHTLEHVNKQGGEDAIAEFARVLVPGGILDIRVPDMEWVFKQPIDEALRVIYGDQTVMPDPDLNAHRWGYTKLSLTSLLARHSFTVTETPVPEHEDEIHLIARSSCSLRS